MVTGPAGDLAIAMQRYFRGLADTAPIPLWRAGPDGACIHVNRAWLDFTGSRLEDALDDGWATGVHPDDVDPMREAAGAALRGREPVDLEYRLRRHDGSWRWLHDRRRPMFEDGAFDGVLGCSLDWTDFRDKDAECRQALADRDRLLEELHHRARNTAQIASSALSLQAARATEPLVARALRAAALRIGLSALVQEKMLLADPAGGVELGEVLIAVAEAAIVVAANPRLRLEADRSVALRLPVARAQPLALAAAELIANAALHAYPAPAQGRIGLRLEQVAGGACTLSIDDDGIGLPPELPRRTPTGQLGLHLVARLARQARAMLIWRPGPGTHASLRFER